MERVFGPDGVILASPSSDCIFAIRQICLFAKKLKLPCSNKRERAAEAGYVALSASCVPMPFITSLQTHLVVLAISCGATFFAGLPLGTLLKNIVLGMGLGQP
jgi:hypothetical protein